MKATRLSLDHAPERPDDGVNMSTYVLDADPRTLNGAFLTIPVDQLSPSPYQHRQTFDAMALRGLGESLGPDGPGQLQPIVVRPRANGGYEIVAGERRVRAARLVGLPTVLAMVRKMSDTEARIAAAAENLLREELNDWETAFAYVDLQDVVRQETRRTNAGAGLMARVPNVRHERSQIQEYLIVAERIPKALLLTAGAGCADDPTALDPVVMRELGITALAKIARVQNNEELLEQLRCQTERARVKCARAARPEHTSRESPLAEDGTAQSLGTSHEGEAAVEGPRRVAANRTYRELLDEGQWRKNLVAPLADMDPTEATRHLSNLAPVVAALAAVAAEHRPTVRVLSVDGAPLTVLVIPTSQTSSTLDRTAALRHLLELQRASAQARALIVQAGGLQDTHATLVKRLDEGDRTAMLSQALAAAEHAAQTADWSPGQWALASSLRRRAAVNDKASSLDLVAAVRWTRRRLEQAREQALKGMVRRLRRVDYGIPSRLHATGLPIKDGSSEYEVLKRPMPQSAGSVTLRWDRSSVASRGMAPSLSGVDYVTAFLSAEGDQGVALTLSVLPSGRSGSAPPIPERPFGGEEQFRITLPTGRATLLGGALAEHLKQLEQVLGEYEFAKRKGELAKSIGLTTGQVRQLTQYQPCIRSLRTRIEAVCEEVSVAVACELRISEIDGSRRD